MVGLGIVVALVCGLLFLLAGPIAWTIVICVIIGLVLWFVQTVVALIAPIFVYLVVGAIVLLVAFIAIGVWLNSEQEKLDRAVDKARALDRPAHQAFVAQREADNLREQDQAFLRNAVMYGEEIARQIVIDQDEQAQLEHDASVAAFYERQAQNEQNAQDRIEAKRLRRANRMRAVVQGVSATQQVIEGGLKTTVLGVGVAAITAEVLLAHQRAAQAAAQQEQNRGRFN